MKYNNENYGVISFRGSIETVPMTGKNFAKCLLWCSPGYFNWTKNFKYHAKNDMKTPYAPSYSNAKIHQGNY